MSTEQNELLTRAKKHAGDIVSVVMNYSEERSAVVVFDRQCVLSDILTKAYRSCLPRAQFIDFDEVPAEKILEIFDSLEPQSLAVLIQSSSFRLNEFRIRMELFKREIKVVEHPHLGRMPGEEIRLYVDSLAYDASYYRGMGRALQERIERARRGAVDSGEGAVLSFDCPFEPVKLNVGDYSGMKNVGGQFPIGEVFTEAKDLEAVSGRMRVFAFGDTSFAVNKPEKPVTIIVSKGRIVSTENTTDAFEEVLAQIRADEGEIWVRELGFGLNRAFTRERIVNDIGTYERMCGIHLSIGAKHGLYKKPQFKDKHVKYHVDIFADTKTVLLDDEVVYQDGQWCP